MSDRTVLDLYRHELARQRVDHYIHATPGGRRTFSTVDFQRRTAALADALEALGVIAGDRVMMLCETRPEWHMADLAILDVGAVNAPVYGTLTPDQVGYQLQDSGAVAAIAEDAEQMEKILHVRSGCPAVRHLIQLEGDREADVFSLDDLMEGGDEAAVERFWERAGRIDPESLATIVYTSGTTGEPKGVMLTHHNIVTNALESMERIDVSPDEAGLEFLPLCHMIERIAGYVYMAVGASRVYCSVYHVAELLREARPAAFACVPRVLEKVHAGIMARAKQGSPLRRALFKMALGIGERAAEARLEGRRRDPALAAGHWLADRLVLARVREAFGGRLRVLFGGGAAVPVHIHRFFQALGIPVQEAWGLTETSPVITLNGAEPGDMRLGSVGRPLPSYELKVAEDGELLVRGPSVFCGYWNKPAQTAEAFDDAGFFHTGDIGTIDDDGFVFITDRKKDLIVTAGGKNVAPQPIESALKRSPLIENAVLVGDGRPFIAALVSPDPDGLVAWANAEGKDASDLPSLMTDPDLERAIDGEIERINASLARYEQVKKSALLPEPLTVEGGELTPTLKVRRRIVAERHADLIDRLYH